MNPAAVVTIAVFLAIIIVVHFFYQGLVRPFAEAAIAAQGSGATTNIWVIFKDFEQQASVSIGLFCAFLIIYKYQRIVLKEEPLFTMDYLSGHVQQRAKVAVVEPIIEVQEQVEGAQKAEGVEGAIEVEIAPQAQAKVSRSSDESIDVSQALEELEASRYAENSSMATWINCLRRFKNTQNVQHASQAISDSVDILAAQLESGNSMIRYFIWAIPSIGFIGTVRGIGSALAKAEEAVAGDISGMVDKLGVAFNSTLVSLLISIVLMYLLHVLNNRQDEMVINTRKNCEKHLLTRLHN
jgi:biopolymer transport protein ExbB/TolQ